MSKDLLWTWKNKKFNFFLLFRMSVIFRENNAFEDANKESGIF